MTTEQQQQIESLRLRAEDLRTDIHALLDQITGPHFNPVDAERVSALNAAKSSASDCRLHLLDAKQGI